MTINSQIGGRGNVPGFVAALLLAGGLAGCGLPAGPPVPLADLSAAGRGCPRGTVPPEYQVPDAAGLPAAARAVVDLALAEWRSWGGQIVDFRVVDPIRTRAVQELSGDQAAGPYPLLAAAGCWENDLRLFTRLRAYWQPLYGEAAPTLRARERLEDEFRDSALAVTAGRPTSWTVPWSAAFISWVATAGGRDHPAAGGFAYGESHETYVGAVLAEGGPPQRYLPRRVDSFAPRPGDIVCSYRSQVLRPRWSPDQAEWRLGPAHCDIVVASESRGGEGRLLAVGGNVLQAVSLGVHAVDAQGRLSDGMFRRWAIVLADRANLLGTGLP